MLTFVLIIIVVLCNAEQQRIIDVKNSSAKFEVRGQHVILSEESPPDFTGNSFSHHFAPYMRLEYNSWVHVSLPRYLPVAYTDHNEVRNASSAHFSHIMV